MLSRTANSIYWLARYMERLENLARLIEVSERLSLLPGETGEDNADWQLALIVSGAPPATIPEEVPDRHAELLHYLVADPANPSSLLSSLELARRNGRAVRISLTAEMWESLNTTYLGFESRWKASRRDHNLRPFLDWIRERSAHFYGALEGTMVRDEAYCFARIGTFLERADNTARLLDVKYHVLLPEKEGVGSWIDYFQWTHVLRAVSALGSYHYFYRENPRPWKIAELLILREEMPRSLLFCVHQVQVLLDRLAGELDGPRDCHRAAGKLFSRLRYSSAGEIIQEGLHEWLLSFLADNNDLAARITRAYLL